LSQWPSSRSSSRRRTRTRSARAASESPPRSWAASCSTAAARAVSPSGELSECVFESMAATYQPHTRTQAPNHNLWTAFSGPQVGNACHPGDSLLGAGSSLRPSVESDPPAVRVEVTRQGSSQASARGPRRGGPPCRVGPWSPRTAPSQVHSWAQRHPTHPARHLHGARTTRPPSQVSIWGPNDSDPRPSQPHGPRGPTVAGRTGRRSCRALRGGPCGGEWRSGGRGGRPGRRR
jgi:hypothetical protein